MGAAAAVPAYEHHRPVVLRVLARRCGWLDPGDREALFHDAYAVMLDKRRRGELEVMAPAQVRAYLIQTALYKALDEGRRAGRKRSVSLDDEASALVAPGDDPAETIATSIDNERLREIVAELPKRRQTIIKLRFFFDRAPAEIQRFLGITERTYRKELERGLGQVAEAYRLVREGSFCESRRSLILAYVGGIAGPNRAVEARRHLASCPACAHWAVELRESAQKAAALLPPLPALSQRSSGLPLLDSLRDAVERATAVAKQHASALAGGVDPSHYVAALRPGALTAAVAGCIAIGGGTTYCVTNGVPNPFAGIHHRGAKAAAHAPRKHEATKPKRSTSDRPPPLRPGASTTPQPQRQHAASKPRPKARPLPASSSPDPDEFGFEPTPSAASAPPAPRGAPPAQSPGEFDP